MLRTPVIIETHTRNKPFKPERPRFDEAPGTTGSHVNLAIRQFLAERQGYAKLKGAPGWSTAPMGAIQGAGPSGAEAPPPKPWSLQFDNVWFYYPAWAPNRLQPNR